MAESKSKLAGRHREGARSRQRILECTATLFAEQGYAATGISLIAERAGVRANSIYWAFENKEALLLAVLEHLAGAYFSKQLVRPAANLLELLQALAADFTHRPEFLRLMLVLALERREGDPRVLTTARAIRLRAVTGLAAELAPHIPDVDARTRAAIAAQLAHQVLLFLDGALIAQQIDDGANLAAAAELAAQGLVANLAQLITRATHLPATETKSCQTPPRRRPQLTRRKASR